MAEGAPGSPALEIAGKPVDQVVVEWGGCQLGDELRVGDGVEAFRQVCGQDGGAGRGFALIEGYCDGLDQREEGSCGGAEGAENVL